MQDAKQEGEHPAPNAPWPKGTSGNPRGSQSKAARKARIDQIISAWAAPFGGPEALKPAERHLATIAAELSLQRPRRHEDMIRQAGLISRLLAQCGLATRTIRDQPVAEYTAAPPFNRETFDVLIDDAMAKARASRGETG